VKEVLIIGNGISRLEHQDFIQKWQGEIWTCNWAFKDLIDKKIPRIDILIGDKDALKEAYRAKKRYKLNYKLLCKNTKALSIPEVKKVEIPERYIKDSGSTLVVKALYENYGKIFLVGFDLGGKDIYVKNHERRNKSKWVDNWRKIARVFGLERIHFVGIDHKPFILSEMPINSYARKYMNGEDHLKENFFVNYPVKSYQEENVKRTNNVLILGNGRSRENSLNRRFIKNWREEIWVCNDAYYREYNNLNRIDRVGTRFTHLVFDMLEFKEKHNLDYDVYTIEKVNKDVKLFYTNSFKTGMLLLVQALYEEYDMIWLSGFDFGGDHIYKNRAVEGLTYRKQMNLIRCWFNVNKIKFVEGQPKFLNREKYIA